MAYFTTGGVIMHLLDDGSLAVRIPAHNSVKILQPQGPKVLKRQEYQAHADGIRDRSFAESKEDMFWGSVQSTHILHEFAVNPICTRCFEE